MEDFAQAGRHRPHLRPFDALRHFDRRQPFVDELAGEVDVGAVLEGHHHLRQPELRDRPQLLQARQAADRLLDGKRDLLLDFFGPERRGDRC